ncbi:zinc finger CCHC domain-containing protein 3-like [Onychostoma macrolepis]|uniref:zinc finger CCHC domain-containing protein 3-like n=1 Tax=Onychostoma macrolepis TaxID=369639 RepID=UPI002729F0F6|nr:zinc finger CCHC domain-containing protein 3-like [Onychostoma macrolepis]
MLSMLFIWQGRHHDQEGDSRRARMAVQGQRRNAARFVLLEDLEMDRLTFSRRKLQSELGFNHFQLDFFFALPGRKTFEVIFTTLLLYEQCLERFQRKKNKSACFQKIDLIPLAERELRIVTVVMFSERIKLEDISTWLSLHCSFTKAFQIKDVDGVKTGASRFHVRLRTNEKGELSHLPSMIQLGSIRGFVFYNGQPKECRKCGSLSHLAAQCDAVFCRNCKNHGHNSKACNAPMKCNLCGATNHRFQDCPSAYVNKARQRIGATQEGEINLPEILETEEDFFSDCLPLVPVTMEEQCVGVTLTQSLSSNPVEEDVGVSGGKSDVESKKNVPLEHEIHQE